MALLPQDPKKQKQVLLIIAPLLLAFLYYYFYHTKRATAADALDESVVALVQRNDAVRAGMTRFGDLTKRLAIFNEHVRQLEQLIPKREDVPVLINQITERAQALNVELAGLNPSIEEAGQFYAKQSYEITVLGDFHSIGEYLTAIGSLSRVVRAFDMKLSVDEHGAARGGASRLRAMFRIETYIVPEPTAPTDSGNVTNATG